MQIGSLQEVIDQYVHDDQSVALEGFTHLIPFAAGHEILRQKKRELHLIRMTPDLIYDQLIGAGCARALTFSWGGNPGVGSLHRLRDAVENDWPRPLTIHEHSHAGMAAAYTAGAARLPFGMLRGYVGTDLSGVNAQIRQVRCPYTNEIIATVPAINPDVTVLHAQAADR
ncbi:MAG: 3-oxoadipate--succinyl-CoA transferase subunit A, partial [Verrucomicrobia bacterium]